ncbi:hypothetical protein [Intestinibacillus sp. Marseille-P6563]|uniref:hypothetical protein n=1 Tax=Intestinibacillus sp. Marseille-P6563 TaxID=2364792 RepID=UPI000F057B6F|nr:hypothetical protein [Intestinibacillus sp. Marseille-P6563]
MRTLQYATLGLFALFAVLTVFFQFRIGMKDGQAQRENSSEAKQAGERFSHLARSCAVLAAVFLVICMVLGALSR